MNKTAISDLVKSINSGSLTAGELVRKSLQTAKQNSSYHSLLEINPEAEAEAVALDKLSKKETENMPLLGVPFVVKDNFLDTETKTTAASKMLEQFKSPYRATAIKRLQAAGAVLIGKANLDEFAHGSSTENSAYGPTKNPFDTKRVPGGSSGGSAAAVALEIAPLALGTDTGGSIRLPASYCGVVGLKPTYGLVSRYGVIAMASSADTVGPMAGSVADCALALDVIAGKDPLDSATIERSSDYSVKPASLNGLRVGLIKQQQGYRIQPALKKLLDGKIASLEAAGAEVKVVDIPMDELALAVYYIIVPAEISSNLARYDGVKYGVSDANAKDLIETYLTSRGRGFGAETTRRILTGTYVLSSGYQDAYYKQAQSVRTLLKAEYEAAFEKVDVLISLTAPTTAFKLGEKQDPLTMYMSDSLTISANLTGMPAISLPAGNVDGLPVGLQLTAPQRQDRKLLEVALALEGLPS